MSEAVYLLEVDEISTKFSAPVLHDEDWKSGSAYEYNRKLKNALRRLTGCSSFLGGLLTIDKNRVGGYFGVASWSGGIHPNGEFTVRKIK